MAMSNPTPNVNCSRGAPMGRHTGPRYLEVAAGRLYLRHMPLDGGGYDRGGAYWGAPNNLYYVEDQDGNGYFLRANSRQDAKRQIAKDWEGATFYR